MKQAKRITALFLAVLLIAVSVPYAFAASLNYTSKNLYYGKTLKLKATSGTAYAWSSSNSDVATVSESGKVKGVGLGTAVITAKVGSQTVSCKVKVKDRNVTAAVSFKSSTGGAFINKVNEAVIGVKPLKYNAAKATVYVKDATDTIVYKTTLTNLTKNVGVYPHWNGKNNKGVVVPNGTYTVYVKIGKQVSKSNALAFLNKNYFAAGDGSAKNPFQVATVDQLKQIVRYPNACFKQTKNLDCGYENVGGFFTEDLPFNGVYDGNGKTISNIAATAPLFSSIGEKGQIKNITIKNGSFTSTGSLANKNKGKIINCNLDVIVSSSSKGSYYSIGGICSVNEGTINACKVNGIVTIVEAFNLCYAGGIAGKNAGKIIMCSTNNNISATAIHDVYTGGISGLNESTGFIQNCETGGSITATATNRSASRPAYPGAISGQNDGQILNCFYSGDTSISLAGIGTGVVA